MKFGSRWQRVQSYTSLGAWYSLAILDDDEFTWKDTPETLILGISLGLIWSPQIAMAIPATAALTLPLAVVEGAALTGLAASYAIGGTEGAETYIDYITDPVDIVKNPEKAEALMGANRIMQGVITLGGSELARAGVDAISNYSEEIFKNRWMNPLGLSF